jgi:16S rRNA (guanine527-N7)-methyltransferase
MLEKHQELLSSLNVSRETLDKIRAYKSLLLKWNNALNLIAQSTVALIDERHIADSAQLAYLINDTDKRIVDFGSGGGLPLIVLAILKSNHHFIGIESDAKKAIFLKECIRILLLDNVEVSNNRIESIEKVGADLCISRACAPLEKLLEYSLMHSVASGRSLFLKGKQVQKEIQEVKRFDFDYILHQSVLQSESCVVEIIRLKDHENYCRS